MEGGQTNNKASAINLGTDAVHVRPDIISTVCIAVPLHESDGVAEQSPATFIDTRVHEKNQTTGLRSNKKSAGSGYTLRALTDLAKDSARLSWRSPRRTGSRRSGKAITANGKTGPAMPFKRSTGDKRVAASMARRKFRLHHTGPVTATAPSEKNLPNDSDKVAAN